MKACTRKTVNLAEVPHEIRCSVRARREGKIDERDLLDWLCDYADTIEMRGDHVTSARVSAVVSEPPALTQGAASDAVWSAARALNTAIADAHGTGLRIEITTERYRRGASAAWPDESDGVAFVSIRSGSTSS